MQPQNLFSPEEYHRRLEVVRHGMRERDLGSLLVSDPSNICYLTGYQTFGETRQFLIVPETGEVAFVLRELEASLVQHTTWSGDVLTFTDGADGLEVLAAALAERGLLKQQIGVDEDTGSLSPATHRALISLLDCTRLVASSGVVEGARVVKSDVEIAACRQAARLTGIGMGAAIEAAVPGATENSVAGAAAEAMFAAGSEWLATDPIVTSGARSSIAHTTFARRALEPGEAVLIELGASYYRYFAPLMRTVTIGPPDPATAQLYAVCQEALEAAMSVIRPGVTSGRAHEACQQVIDAHGFTERFKKRLGYSVGIGFQTWSEGRFFDLKADDDRPIRAGMVLHMPPALRVPSRVGVGTSETIVVTADGCEALGTFPRRLYHSA